MFRGRIRSIHFVGVGGVGMSGIAEVLLNLGFTVSGSDLRTTKVTDRLADLGARDRRGRRWRCDNDPLLCGTRALAAPAAGTHAAGPAPPQPVITSRAIRPRVRSGAL